MNPPPSPYYPPRARWYSPCVSLWFKVRRRLHLEEMNRALGCSLPRLLAVVLLPGYGFVASGRASIGKGLMAVYGVGALVFVLWLGRAPANVAFGLMLSLHATGILSFLASRRPMEFRQKIGLTVAVLILLSSVIYLPLRHWVTERWLLPLRVRDQVIVVRARHDPTGVRRGDWIAYRIESQYLGNRTYLTGGYGFERVLGVPGDRIQFAPDSFSVNGDAQPLLVNMPTNGGWVVPEKQWFVWPELAIHSHGVAEATIASAWSQVAFVDQAQFMGQPLQRWFWRRQTLP